MQVKNAILIAASFMILLCALPSRAQQKGQWVPGQFGLNAGVIPDPGITYANLVVNYSATQLYDSGGSRILRTFRERIRSGQMKTFSSTFPSTRSSADISCPIFRSTWPTVRWSPTFRRSCPRLHRGSI